MKRFFIGFILLGCLGCSGSEADHPVLSLERKDVHIAAGFITWQLPELLRQLKLSAYVDLGPAWKDYGDNGLEYGKPPVAQFDATKGTVGELLNAYCAKRDLVWDLRGKQGVITIESQKASLRRTNTYLATQFNQPVDLSSDKNEITMDSVASAWRDVIKEGIEVQITNDDDLRKLPLSINKKTKSFTAIIDHWLHTAPQTMVWLKESRQGEKVTAILDIGSTPIDLESKSNAELLAAMLDRTAATTIGPNNFNKAREYCINEYYRRWCTDRDSATKAYLAFGQKISDELLKPGSNLKYEFQKGGIRCFGELQFELLKSLTNEMKIKFLNESLLPTPLEDGAQWVKHWSNLQSSDFAEIRDAAKSVLDEFEKSKK